MEKSRKIEWGIYLCAILMMGVIAVSSNISNIASAFPDESQTKVITYLISVPCLIVIPVTVVTGKLMEYMAKKVLMIVGVLFWLIGGTFPYFISSLTGILAMRCIFGVGVGMIQTLCAALIMENFQKAEERDAIMGNMTAFQMLGAVIFAVTSGNLGKLGWNTAFLVHLTAIVSLAAAVICIPYKKPEKSAGGKKKAFRPNRKMWVWVFAFFLFMIAGQTYSNTASSIITEMELGGSTAAGYSLAMFAFGGFVMGFLFGRAAKILKSYTLSAGCLMLACSYLMMIFASNLLLAYLGAFVCGLAFSVCMPCIINGTGNAVDQGSSEMAVSIATGMQNVGMAVSPYIVIPAGKFLHSSVISGLTENQCAMLSAIVIILILGALFLGGNRFNKGCRR